MMLGGLLLLALMLLALWFAMRHPDRLEDRYASEVAHHRGALAQIAADIDEPQAVQALTLDVQRRLLRLRRSNGRAAAPPSGHLGWVYVMSIICIGLALFGYVKLGNRRLADVPAAVAPAPAVAAQKFTRAKALLQQEPTNISAWIDLSMAMQDQGDTAGAIAALERASKYMPTDADLWVARGQALMAHGGGALSPAARLAFDRASRLNPKHPGPRLYLALAWLQAGQPKAALPLLDQLLQEAPANAPWRPRAERMQRGAKAMIAAGVGEN